MPGRDQKRRGSGGGHQAEGSVPQTAASHTILGQIVVSPANCTGSGSSTQGSPVATGTDWHPAAIARMLRSMNWSIEPRMGIGNAPS